MRILTPVIAAAVVIALGAYIHLTLKEARYLYSGPVVINVIGEGEAVAVPDIATFSFSVRAEGEDAADAQSQSAESVNAILEYLKDEGVEDADVKTQYYNLNPRYEYPQTICPAGNYCPPGERVLVGYEVSQNISVKVRNTDMAGSLISGVGEFGATDVSGLNFTIDDEDNLKAEAREAAIANAQEQAKKLADDLGVRIVRMSGFWEDQGNYYSAGYGGDARIESSVMMDKAVVPSVPSGENTVKAQVNVSYEVR